MGPKKGRRVQIEVPTGSVPEFDLGDTAEEGGEGGKRKGGEDTETEGGNQDEGRRKETTHSPEGVAEKHARTNKSNTELDTCTAAGGEGAHLSRTHNKRRGT